ncbi:hypothetical protein [Endozoicomonas atrinae]|uniref:hypothetical protein n=1 Tax=Endozoicomonas atrinae TaxID=1333660 RepID=UPI003B000C91
MNAVEASVAAGYHPGQNQADNDVGQTKHWTQSRTVRAVAGIAVLALGGLAGLAASFFASTFVAIIAAAAVTVVVGVAVIGYFYHHSGDSHTPEPPPSPFPVAQPIQPPPYTATYVPPPPYSPPSAPAPTATAYAPAVSSNTLPSDPPPVYARYGTPAARVVDPSDPPPEYTALIAEQFIRDQESRTEWMLQAYDLELYKSCRNGNCYFDSVINQCPAGSNWTIHSLRNRVYQEAVQWCDNYASNYDPTIHSSENDLYERLIFQNGLEALRADREWVDATDSMFTAKVLNTPIVVLNIDGGVGHAFDAGGLFMNDVINASRNLDYYRTVLNDRFILLVFDTNHFMGINPIR